jgi:effector-binding domain-containing protein
MAYTIEMKDRPAQQTVGLRTHSPVQQLPTLIPQTCDGVVQYLSQQGKPISGEAFVGYYNMDMENLDVEIGFTSAEPVPGNSKFTAGTIPGGKSASVLHVGSYAKLYEAHGALHDWMTKNGKESASGYYELYLNDPANTPEDQLKTEVFTLLK